ncbi:MAG: killer suppression protein [Deltaproteobacteria bacterium]|nr:killer suppression protein [Deltaproteobacteria bacterium]
MRIFFKTKKLQKICSEESESRKQLGAKCGLKLQQRMMELKAAQDLADISRLPPARCHELTGNRTGQLSVDLVHPYRLLFVVTNNPYPERSNGGLDWNGVTEIEIIEIADTH